MTDEIKVTAADRRAACAVCPNMRLNPNKFCMFIYQRDESLCADREAMASAIATAMRAERGAAAKLVDEAKQSVELIDQEYGWNKGDNQKWDIEKAIEAYEATQEGE